MIKSWKHSLTMLFAGWLVMLGAVVQYLAVAQPDFTPFLGKWGGLLTIAIGITNVLIRLRTVGAIAGTLAARDQVNIAAAEAPIHRRVEVEETPDEYRAGRAQFEIGREPAVQPPAMPEQDELPSHLRHPSRL